MPSSGTVAPAHAAGPGIRVDAAIYPGQEVTLYYDPMIAKLIALGRDREEARRRIVRALKELRLVGISTCAPLMLAVLEDERFLRGEFDTSVLERFVNETGGRTRAPSAASWPTSRP